MAHLSDTLRHIRPMRVSFFQTLRSMVTVHHQRRRLSRLDDRALQDIGLTRDTARSEVRRPFWDIPAAQRGTRC